MTNKKLRSNPTYILMVNVAFADLNVSLFVETFTIVGKNIWLFFHKEKSSLRLKIL